MKLISNESAQSGGLIMFVVGIFIVGFFYVAFGAIMQELVDANNDLINNADMEYSQSHWDTMDSVFTYWWGFPIFAVVLFVLYIIRNALNKEEGII